MKNSTNILLLVCAVCFCNGTGIRRFSKITTGVNETFTPDAPLTYSYKFFPAIETGDPYNGCFTFKFLGTNDLHVALTQYAEKTLPPIQAIIGGWRNQKSKFRINGQDSAEFKTPDIIKPNVYNSFWIKWSINLIEVGWAGETVPFMTYQALNLNPVLFIGIYTCCGSTGKWIFEEPNCPNFANTLITNEPDNVIKEKILKQSNFMKQMESQIQNFNKISKNPTTEFIEFYVDELLENYKKCKTLNEEILSYPSDFIQDYINGHVYGNIQKTFYIFLDALYNLKRFLAAKNLLISYPALQTKYSTVVSKSSNDEYEYFKLNNETCVSFKILASKNIHLTLGNAESTDIWKIFIGGWFNTKSGIVINSELVTEEDTPNILSLDKFTGFQLEWSDRYIKLIKKDTKSQILTYAGRRNLKFDKIGIPNEDAVLVFDDSPCAVVDIRIN